MVAAAYSGFIVAAEHMRGTAASCMARREISEDWLCTMPHLIHVAGGIHFAPQAVLQVLLPAACALCASHSDNSQFCS